jgi:hypothetical protein
MPVHGYLPESVIADSMHTGQWGYTLEAVEDNSADSNCGSSFTGRKYQNFSKPIFENLDLAKGPLFVIPIFQEIEPRFLSRYCERSPRPPTFNFM